MADVNGWFMVLVSPGSFRLADAPRALGMARSGFLFGAGQRATSYRRVWVECCALGNLARIVPAR
eukprot:394079-Pyramimonas_sp.AAC.1